jgi:homospermidine synthase
VTGAALRETLSAHEIDQVVEVANVDTLESAQICAATGADYLSTSFGLEAADPHAMENRVMVAAQHLLPEKRPVLRGSHLLGSGMNPGVVNALVYAGLEELAEKVGVEPNAQALDLYAIYITEQDSTELNAAPIPPGVFASTWSPQHFLEEMLEPEAMIYRDGQLLALEHSPHRREYWVRCGAETVPSMVAPHEEIVTLGHAFPSVEMAFLYALAPGAKSALAQYPDRPLAEWETQKLYPPHEYRLRGADRVGALLCSRRYGELWVGFDTDVELGLRYGTNATQLQVAAGLLAGWGMLGTHRGIHVVEDLPWRRYLARVEDVLGPRRSYHVPDAPERRLAARRV